MLNAAGGILPASSAGWLRPDRVAAATRDASPVKRTEPQHQTRIRLAPLVDARPAPRYNKQRFDLAEDTQ
jgi:hypothetical protein